MVRIVKALKSSMVVAVVWLGVACTSEAGPIDPSLSAFDVRRVQVLPLLDTVFAADTIRATDRLQLSATIRGVGDRPIDGARAVWYSEDTTIAVVSGDGLVTPRQYGTVRIVASAGKRGYATVVVVPAVSRVDVTPSTATLFVGVPIAPSDTVRLRAVARDASGAVVTGTRIVWSSANPAIATVDSTGVVRALALGSAQILARNNGMTGTATVLVAPR